MQTLGTMFCLSLGVRPFFDHFLIPFLFDCFVCACYCEYFFQFLHDCVCLVRSLASSQNFGALACFMRCFWVVPFEAIFACVEPLSLSKGGAS